MKNFIIFLVLFAIVYLFYFIFVISRKKVLKKFTKGKELTFLKYKNNLDYSKFNIKALAHLVALANAFILSITVTIISIFNNFLIQMLVGLLVLIPLILIIYGIIGKVLKKKQNERKK